MSFANQYGPWAVIAGASEGTGRAFAHAVAAAGIHCILLARRPQPLALLHQELASLYPVEVVTACVDLADSRAMDVIAKAVEGREVGLYISNAGADSTNARFLDAPVEDWIEQVNRNVLTVIRCCHHFGRAMCQRGRGGIILVGSGACYSGGSYLAVYGGSKAFDLCFGEGLWAEFKPKGVDVLNLILGRTDTPAFRATLAKTGQPVPKDLAAPEAVAEVGLAQLANGPVYNWGLADDEPGWAMTSAAARRARILAIEEQKRAFFKGSD